jgi:xyloglucan:xyloglucosyl transferase
MLRFLSEPADVYIQYELFEVVCLLVFRKDFYAHPTLAAIMHLMDCRFFVDDTPIRVFRNNEAIGVPYLNSQPMPILAAVWDGSTWATQGGKYPIDWAYQPFVASYQGFGVDGCLVVNNDISYCAAGPVDAWWNAQHYQYLTPEQITTLKSVQSNYVYYDYCNDKVRYPIVPPECVKNWYGS